MLRIFFFHKKGSKDILADIETVLVEPPPSINICFPFRKFDENRVPMSHVDEGQGEIFLKDALKFQKTRSRTRTGRDREKSVPDPPSSSKLDKSEKDEIEEDDLDSRRGGDKKRGIWEGGKEGHDLEKDQGEELVDVDQK